jgi:hypothetical protein
MGTKIELQPRHEQHLARWEELQALPELAKLPFKIETDRLGRILMGPPPFFSHARYAAIPVLNRQSAANSQVRFKAPACFNSFEERCLKAR